MPDTPYSANVMAPFDRLPFRAWSPEAEEFARMTAEVRQLREEVQRLRETIRLGADTQS